MAKLCHDKENVFDARTLARFYIFMDDGCGWDSVRLMVDRNVWDSRTGKAKGLSQEQLGRAVGVAKNTVSVWERGERQPRSEDIHKAAIALDVPIDYLEGLIDSPTAILTDRETAEFVEAQEQEVLEKMIDGYRKLKPQYQRVIRAMVSTLQKIQEYESL